MTKISDDRGFRLRWLVLWLLLPALSNANVTLPAIFNDHMVLQQQREVTIWGWARALEPITVIASWDRQAKETTADNHANWQVKLKTPVAGGPYTLIIMGYNTIVLQDVMIGEVWLCSGQSNMEWSANNGIDHSAEEIARSNHPDIRFFQVAHRTATVPQLDVAGQWTACTPQSMANFSAIGYFFGRELQQKLHVPIGLINSSWGGTPAEAWMNPEVVRNDEEFARAAARFTPVAWCPMEPGATYHTMIAPLIPFPIVGVIWYQGETNTLNPIEYRRLFPALIASWRNEWQNNFPFYYVQIAPYNYGPLPKGVLLREAQLLSLAVPNTGMVVVSDIGNIHDIHPRNKLDVGRRLANWALARTYGHQGIVYSGPIYRRMAVEGRKIRLFFDYAEAGLICKGQRLTHFQIAGADRNFVEAEAEIDGATVLVHSAEVKKPVAVRFGWSNTAEPNLFNAAGLPASSFRTDDWEVQFE
jgi:sialate O-acetylesterase